MSVIGTRADGASDVTQYRLKVSDYSKQEAMKFAKEHSGVLVMPLTFDRSE